MNADPAIQLRLLDLQAVDAALARLDHRRESVPEAADVASADERLTALRADLARAEVEIGDIDREQRRLEADVDQVRQRAARDQKLMQAGTVGSPKDLENLQHEVESLARRQSDLEDQVLEVMESQEALEGRVGALRADLAELTARRDAALARRDKTYAEIDDERAQRVGERERISAELPGDLLALYERIRQSAGGVGAAALRGRRCEGCRLEMAGTDLAEARTAAPDVVLRCENCRRILVRTAESGL